MRCRGGLDTLVECLLDGGMWLSWVVPVSGLSIHLDCSALFPRLVLGCGPGSDTKVFEPGAPAVVISVISCCAAPWVVSVSVWDRTAPFSNCGTGWFCNGANGFLGSNCSATSVFSCHTSVKSGGILVNRTASISGLYVLFSGSHLGCWQCSTMDQLMTVLYPASTCREQKSLIHTPAPWLNTCGTDSPSCGCNCSFTLSHIQGKKNDSRVQRARPNTIWAGDLPVVEWGTLRYVRKNSDKATPNCTPPPCFVSHCLTFLTMFSASPFVAGW